MAKLKSHSQTTCCGFFQKGCQPLGVCFEIWRQLKKHRSEAFLLDDRLDGSSKSTQASRAILEARNVGDPLWSLKGKAEVRSCIRKPRSDCCRARQTAERIVDLYGIQLRRIELQKLFRWSFRRVKIGLPCRISPAGAANKNDARRRLFVDLRGRSQVRPGRLVRIKPSSSPMPPVSYRIHDPMIP